jgi:ABC-type polysaccharide transport system permease subunit
MVNPAASIRRSLEHSWQLYAFLVPAILFVAVFRYGPMYGLQLAFKTYNARLGIGGSHWAGLEQFARLFSFEKVILLQSSLNLRSSEVLTTYVYKTGLLEGNFDFATAGGLFNSAINLALVVLVNRIARRLGETSLW